MRLKIGIVGADSFHVSAFVTLLLEDRQFKDDVESLHIFVDKSSTMSLSTDRQPKIVEKLSNYEIEWVNDISLISGLDAYMILSVDADTHLKHFQKLIKEGKPIFIDKPVTYSLESAKEIQNISIKHNIPVFSSSALRYSPFVLKAKELSEETSAVIEVSGTLTYQDEIEGYYWYGIHLLEMLSVFGSDIKINNINVDESQEIIEGSVNNKKFNIVGHLKGNHSFQVKVGNHLFNEKDDKKPIYYYLVKEIIEFFNTNKEPISFTDTLKIIELIESINQSK